jgi:alpha-glucoside transport system substrate-binding protein
MASDGWIEPLADDTAASVASDFDPSVRALAEVDGQLVAIPFRLTLKSLVWYRPEVFAAHGWEVPHTLGELETLARAIETDGSLSPWCFGLESGSATGWAATDWTEDLVLRLLGPDTYREWAQGRLPFADPGIAEAFDMFSRLVLAPGRTQGGISGILETPVDTAAQGLFGAGAGCAMSKQADSAAGSMPPGTTFEPGGDVDVFVLPGVDEDQPAPLVVGSDQIVQFTHSASIDAVMHHLAGTRAAETWAEHGGFLSPNLAVPPSAYPPGFAASLSQLVRDTSVIALDASDQMPPDVGSGVLWDEITGWIAGATSYEEFAARVDAARADAGT